MSERGPEFAPQEYVVEPSKLTLLQGGTKPTIAREVRVRSQAETAFYIEQHNEVVDTQNDLLPLPLWSDTSS